MLLMQGVDFNKLGSVLNADDKVSAVIDSIKFDVLQTSLNLTEFFKQPNVTDVISAAGIPPDMLQVFLMNIDFKSFIEAVQVSKVVELYSPDNNATMTEKAKSLANLINGKKLVNSINWKRLQNDEKFIKMLDNDFTGNTTDPKLIKAVILSIDLHKLMTKSFDFDKFLEGVATNSSLTDAVVKSIDFNEAFSIFDVKKFLAQPNITQTLQDNKINPNLIKILIHANMSKLAVSANIGGIVTAYATGDNNTRPARILEAVNKMDNKGIADSVEWNKLK